MEFNFQTVNMLVYLKKKNVYNLKAKKLQSEDNELNWTLRDKKGEIIIMRITLDRMGVP